MVHVALAGVSTGFGLCLLKHILETKEHQVTLLSRSEKPRLEALGAVVKLVDYDNHDSLVKALQGVHTVISTMGAPRNYDPSHDSQVALIHASVAAGVTRFAPSEFAHGSYEGMDLYAGKRLSWETALSSGLEVTRFSCGLFMNLLATGTPLVDEHEALAGCRPWNYIINMKQGTADLPADGTAKMAWTEINDVCRFVVASLDLEKWPVESTMYGDVVTWTDIIAKTERVRGGEKMLVKNTSIEEMEKLAEDPARRFYHQSRIVIAKGGFENKGELNILCPQVKPVTIDEVLEKWWGGVPVVEPSWGEAKIFGATNM